MTDADEWVTGKADIRVATGLGSDDSVDRARNGTLKGCPYPLPVEALPSRVLRGKRSALLAWKTAYEAGGGGVFALMERLQAALSAVAAMRTQIASHPDIVREREAVERENAERRDRTYEAAVYLLAAAKGEVPDVDLAGAEGFEVIERVEAARAAHEKGKR